MSTYSHFSAATAADDDAFLETVDMANGEYTLDGTTIPTPGARKVTVSVTADDTADTMGTVTIVGRDLAGQEITEVITPIAGSTVSGSLLFKSITSATQAGWVIDGAEGTADDIIIGYGADAFVVDGSGYLDAVVIGTTAAATVVLADAQGTISTLKASIAEGSYAYGVHFDGFLTVDVNGASDVTVVHSSSVPKVYA